MRLDQELNAAASRKEQYQTEEAYRNYLEQSRENTLKEETLAAFLRIYAHTAALIEEEEERNARRERSERMREKWNDVLVRRAFRPEFQESAFEGIEPPRGVLAFLDDARESASNDNNQYLTELVKNKDTERLTSFTYGHLLQAVKYIEHSGVMTDDELVDNFEKLRNACRLVMDIDNLEAAVNDGKLDERLRTVIADARENAYEKSRELMARMQLIANPLYEQMNPYDLEHLNSAALQDDLANNRLPEVLAQADYLGEFADRVGDMNAQEQKKTEAFLMEQLREQEKDPHALTVGRLDGQELGNGTFMNLTGVPLDEPLVITRPNGETRLLTVKKEFDGYRSIRETTEDAAFFEQKEQLLGRIERLIKDADPWYIWSSSEFSRMKKKMKEAAVQLHALENPPTMAQYDKLKKKLQEVETATNRYLEYKGEDGTNVSDDARSRILAARELRSYVKSRLALLDPMERLAQKEQDVLEEGMADKNMPQEEMLQSAFPEQHSESEDALQNEIVQRRRDYQTGFYYSEFEKGSKAFLLHGLTADSVNSDEMGALLQARRFAPEQAKQARHQMAQMVALDLLLEDRRHKPDQVGQMEQTLNSLKDPERFVRSIESNAVFRRLTEKLTAKAFREFFAHHGEQSLSQSLRNSAAQKKSGVQKNNAVKNSMVK